MNDEVLIDVLLMSVLKDEACAHILAESAHELERACCRNSAWRLMDLSRMHQVKALEARARLAALNEEYASTMRD